MSVSNEVECNRHIDKGGVSRSVGRSQLNLIPGCVPRFPNCGTSLHLAGYKNRCSQNKYAMIQ